MKVQYKNLLVKSEVILKYIEDSYKIRYWLKLPHFMRTKEYNIEVIQNNLFNLFIDILTKRLNDKNLFVLGVIEDYFVLFNVMVVALEKNLNLKLSLLTPVKVMNNKDELKTYYVWSTTKSKFLKESLGKLIIYINIYIINLFQKNK